jgi:signal peptidase I
MVQINHKVYTWARVLNIFNFGVVNTITAITPGYLNFKNSQASIQKRIFGTSQKTAESKNHKTEEVTYE